MHAIVSTVYNYGTTRVRGRLARLAFSVVSTADALALARLDCSLAARDRDRASHVAAYECSYEAAAVRDVLSAER